jgi:hypothetical protein
MSRRRDSPSLGEDRSEQHPVASGQFVSNHSLNPFRRAEEKRTVKFDDSDLATLLVKRL